VGGVVKSVLPHPGPASVRGTVSVALHEMTTRYEDLVRRMSLLREIELVGDQDQPLGELCRRLIELVSRHYDAENCSIMLLDDARRFLYLWAATSYMQDGAAFPQGEEALARKFEVGEGIAGRVVATASAVRLDDAGLTELFVPVPGSKIVVRSLLCVPLRWRDRVLGVLNLSHSSQGFFTADDEASATMVAESSARLLANHRRLHRHKVVERCYELACEKAGDGILVFDEDGQVTVANAPAEDLLGPTLRGGTRMMDAWTDRVHPEDRAAFRRAREMLLSTGLPQTCSYRLGADAGSLRHVEERLTVVSAALDQPRQIVCVLRDVTARVRHETEKRELEAQLRHAQKMEAIGELAGGITHDFNNILTGILANVSLARSCADPLELPELLRDIESAARQASMLTRRLLSMSRRSKVERTACEVAALIDEVAGIVRNTVDRRIVVDTMCDHGVWSVLADRSQVHQVLLNLCVNARDALAAKLGVVGADLRITVSARNTVIDQRYCASHVEARTGEFVRIAVADTGSGIEEGIRARIFEPFFTTRESAGGTGLGLAIAYGVVKQHDGWMAVDSVLGQGTTFEFFLPRATEPAEIRKDEAWASEVTPQGSATILVADDEDMMRRTVRRLLSKLGYTVLVARDGLECVEMFAEQREAIDLIILDLNMPRLDGMGALARIRGIDPSVPVIVSSGHTTAIVEEASRSYAPVAYMSKPYTLDTVARTIKQALAHKKG